MAFEITKIPCGWKGCDRDASQHVTYGEESEEQGFDPLDSAWHIGLKIHQADLCNDHVKEMRKSYIDVTETPLN